MKWTEDILAEFIYRLRKKHPTWPGGHITAMRDRLAATFETGRVDDFTVGSCYRDPDPHDAHVHAAAVASRADFIITNDRTGFIWDENESPYEVLTPDEFLLLVDADCPELVAKVSVEMTKYWLVRTGEADLPQRLRTAECPAFAERVRVHLQRLGHAF